MATEQTWDVTLLVEQTLAIDNAAHALTSDEVDLTLYTGTSQEWPVVLLLPQSELEVASADHAITSDTVALGQHVLYDVVAIPNQTLVIDIYIDDVFHELMSDTVAFTQAHVLAINDSTHESTSDNVRFTQFGWSQRTPNSRFWTERPPGVAAGWNRRE